jgi:NIPSNAP
MIVVRDIFQLKFGKARDAVALWQDGLQFVRDSANARETRVLTDLVGQYYTLVLETTYDSLADFESTGPRLMTDQKWRDWYAKFTPLVEAGRREIFTVVGSATPSLGTAERARATV